MEFALIGPLFVMLLIGAVVFGGWMWMAQTVQHAASEAARAAVAGLSTQEREALARATAAQAAAAGGLAADAVTVEVADVDGVVTVAVLYAAGGHPLMALGGVLPVAPPDAIRRTAVVRAGSG